LERIRQPLCARMGVPVRVAVDRAGLDGLRDHLDRAVVAIGMAQQLAHEQRPVHHQAEHGHVLLLIFPAGLVYCSFEITSPKSSNSWPLKRSSCIASIGA